MQRKRLFVTVGTHTQQFNRLMKEVDRLAGEGRIDAKITAQTGNCTYLPENFRYVRFMGDEEYEAAISKADIIISHAGAGSIINSLRNRKPLIIVPRLVEFGEHTNSHQADLAKFLHERKKAIACMDIGELEKALGLASKFSPAIDSDREKLVKALNNYLETVA